MHLFHYNNLIGSSVNVIAIIKIRHYYIEQPIQLSNHLNVSECYKWIKLIFSSLFTQETWQKVQRGSVSEEVEPDMAVAKPKDNLNVI